MNLKDKVAAGLYGLVAVVSLGFAILYGTRREFLVFHERAVGATWSQLGAGERELILAFLRLGASGFLAVGVTIASLTLIPFRRGDAWSRWAIPIVGLSFWIPLFVTTVVISRNTPAEAPWPGTLAVVVVLIVASGLSIRPDRRSTSSVD